MKKPIEYIKETITTYFKKENFLFFAKVMAILTIVSTSLSLLAGYLYPVNVYENLNFSNVANGVGFVALSLAMALFGLYTKSTTLVSVLNTGGDIKQVFLTGWKKAWKYFLVTTAVGLIIFGGLILLIIPGIMFGVWFSFALFLAIDKNMGIKEALKQSKAMVKGRFWKVFGRFIVFGLFGFAVGIVLSLLPYVGAVLVSFASPLFVLPSYLLYKDLVSGN